MYTVTKLLFIWYVHNLWCSGVFAASVTLNQYHTFESQIMPDVTFACVRLCVTIVMMCHTLCRHNCQKCDAAA